MYRNYFLLCSLVISTAQAAVYRGAAPVLALELIDQYGTLFDAVDGRDYTQVEFMLNCFYDVNCQNAKKRTPLYYAVELEEDSITRLLLQRGALIIPDKYGITPLHRAAALGNNMLVDILLKYTVSIDEVDKQSNTALYHAAFYGLRETVAFLLDHGAQPSAISKDNVRLLPDRACRYMLRFYTQLHRASLSDMTSVVELLRKGAQSTPRIWDNVTKMREAFIAVNDRSSMRLRDALNYGISIHAKNTVGETLFGKILAANDNKLAAVLNEHLASQAILRAHT